MLSKNISFWLMHHFTISICEDVFQFNDNSVTQFYEGKGYQGIRTIKIFEFENTRNDIIKKVLKENNMSDLLTIHLPTKLTSLIDSADEPVIPCDVPVVGKTFVDDCK